MASRKRRGGKSDGSLRHESRGVGGIEDKSEKMDRGVVEGSVGFWDRFRGPVGVLRVVVVSVCVWYLGYTAFGIVLGRIRTPAEEGNSAEYGDSPSGPQRGMLRDGIDSLGSEEIVTDVRKLEAVREALVNSYKAYEEDAFGCDAFHPISHSGTNISPAGPIGYFIVDSLDTLLIAGMHEEYARARKWVETLSFDLDDTFHTFEITIRVLGGLLSAYALTADELYKTKAVDLAERLLAAYETPSGIPHSFVNLKTREAIPDRDNGNAASLAEAGTLQLEMKYLSHITGNPVFWDKAVKVIDVIRDQPSTSGLYPLFIDPINGKFRVAEIRLGSRADSYYEYLIKQYLQTSKTEPVYASMHNEAVFGIKSHLLRQSPIRHIYYTSEIHPYMDRAKGRVAVRDVPKQDHLVCFLPSVMMLGATLNQTQIPFDATRMSNVQRQDMFVAKELLKGCVDTYQRSRTGLAPEIVKFYNNSRIIRKSGFDRDWYIDSRKATYPNPPLDARNILRPETVESLFYAYRLTGDGIYRRWAWEIFQAFDKTAKLENGAFASVNDVDAKYVTFDDNMETFWFSETLKYLYLIFSDSETIPLRKYVFNTEAHPLPVFVPKTQK